MRRLVPPRELPKTPLARLCLTIARPPFQLLIGRSPPGLPLDGDKQVGEVSASHTNDGRHRLHIQRECYRAYLDEEMSLQQRRREMHKSRPFRLEHICIDEPKPVDSSRKALSWVQRVYFCKNGSGRETTSNTKLWCGVVDGDQLERWSSAHLRRCPQQDKHCVL